MNLPLPVALLHRRARNAKSAKERHDTAYFAWEASLRLAAPKQPLPGDLDVAAPSAGQFVRWLTSRKDDATLDDDNVLACFALLTEFGTERRSSPRAVSARKLLEAIPPYRNRVLGHGSTRANEFYQSGADVLLSSLDAAWHAGTFLDEDDELVFVEGVELSSSGKRRARVLSLMGLASEAENVDEPPEDVRPSRVYVRTGERWTCLHPWVLYEGGDLRERVLFFNGRARGARFLDYVSGEELKGKPLTEAFPDVDEGLAAAMRSKPRVEASASGDAPDANSFGGYRILGKLGEGGMGVVYLAEQQSLGRVVALKMLPAAAADDAVAVGRFKREISALSKCDHPNVAKIFASGVEKGTHYYAMEFIDGVDLAQVSPQLREGSNFDAAVSTASERLRESKKELFASVPSLSRARLVSREPSQTTQAVVTLFHDAALALQHLHDAGIVHRDVKPANLMVTAADHRLVLMDLGLAAVGDASKTLTRDASSILGTLRYMPPEQLQRNLLDVDHRADIYALGVTFYELLIGRPFFDGDTEARLIEQILRQEPLAPKEANPSLPRDLGVILQKATRKDAKERYASAGALAADLDAFLEGRPIAARPTTLAYVLMLSLRRHRLLAAMSALGLLGVVVGAAAYLTHERALRREAETQRALAEQLRTVADATAIDLLTEQGRAAVEAGDGDRALVLFDEAYRRGGHDVVLREFLGQFLRDGGPVPAAYVPPPRVVRRELRSHGGARRAEWGDDGVIAIFDSATGQELRTLDAHGGAVVHLEFSGDGARLLSTYGDGTARTWDTVSAKLLATVRPDGGVRMAAVQGDGEKVVTASAAGATIWNAETGARLVDLVGHKGGVVVALFDSRGDTTRVLTGGDDATARVWDASGKLLATMQASARVADVRFVDCDLAATACDDGAVTLWDVVKEKAILTIHAMRPVQAVEVASAYTNEETGEHRATFHVHRSDGVVQHWDITFGGKGAPSSKLTGEVGGIASPIESAHDSPARIEHGIAWGTRRGEGVLRLVLGRYEPFAFSPESSFLIWGGDLVDPRGGATFSGLSATPYILGDRTWPRPSFASSKMATAEGVLRITEATTAKLIVEIPAARSSSGKMPKSITLSPDGNVVACAFGDGGGPTRVYRIPGGEKAMEIDGEEDAAVVMFSDARTLVTCRAGHCTEWDALTGAKVRELRGHSDTILDASTSADGKRLVTASSDGSARVWDLATGNTTTTLHGHRAQVLRAMFSSDGSYVATASADGTAKIWDASTGALRTSLDGSGGPIYALSVAGDGVRVATGDSTGTAIVWDARSGKAVDRLRGQGWIVSVEFSPDGSLLAAAVADGTLLVKDVHLESRSADEVHHLVQSRDLPWKLTNGQLVARTLGMP